METLRQLQADSCVGGVSVVQFACDEGLGDGSASADGEPFQYRLQHPQGLGAGDGDRVHLGHHGKLTVDDNTKVLGMGSGGWCGIELCWPPG